MKTRKDKSGKVEKISCPATIVNYSTHMNGVDMADQIRSYYEIGRRSYKWWKYISNFMLDASIINAHILYKLANPGKNST